MFEWGWVVEPDPDYQLSTFLCPSRSTKDGGTISAGLSDRFYCNPAYDALYEQQSTTTDAERAHRDRQADAADALRRRAVRRHLLLRRPRGVPQRPVHQLQPQPTRRASCSSSTAPTPTARSTPVDVRRRRSPVVERRQRQRTGRQRRQLGEQRRSDSRRRLVRVDLILGLVAAVVVLGGRGPARSPHGRRSAEDDASSRVRRLPTSSRLRRPRRRDPSAAGTTGQGRSLGFYAFKRTLTALGTCCSSSSSTSSCSGCCPATRRTHPRPQRRPDADRAAPQRPQRAALRSSSCTTSGTRSPADIDSASSASRCGRSSATASGRRSCWSASRRSCPRSSASGSASSPAGGAAAGSTGSTGGHADAVLDARVLARHDPDHRVRDRVGPLPGIFPTSGLSHAGRRPVEPCQGIVDILYHLILPVHDADARLPGGVLAGHALVAARRDGRGLPDDRAGQGAARPEVRHRHAVPNALLPTFTLIVLYLGFVVSGAITIETVFRSRASACCPTRRSRSPTSRCSRRSSCCSRSRSSPRTSSPTSCVPAVDPRVRT